ncbi:MAG: hypothetical protein M5U28_27435 [Sandaracinaceae bacterium]|nr:hypothetical protein [Sandaracinaceae bacterium]
MRIASGPGRAGCAGAPAAPPSWLRISLNWWCARARSGALPEAVLATETR